MKKQLILALVFSASLLLRASERFEYIDGPLGGRIEIEGFEQKTQKCDVWNVLGWVGCCPCLASLFCYLNLKKCCIDNPRKPRQEVLTRLNQGFEWPSSESLDLSDDDY
ncbi:MAG: hypothetical protein UR26_C0001G0063 [candidate division TM6 bacterium GW2011_GWF2_32_72]|nr:MAG: hypothetical protein UR26_C0001G0063 [candidate division TM6 bacterium GW2011_GWF2_32_72]